MYQQISCASCLRDKEVLKIASSRLKKTNSLSHTPRRTVRGIVGRPANRRRTPGRRQISPIWFAVSLFALLLIVNLVQTTLRDGTTLTYSATLTLLGGNVHADVHRLVVRSDAANELWVTCDGGVFRSTRLRLKPSTGAGRADRALIRPSGDVRSRTALIRLRTGSWPRSFAAFAWPVALVSKRRLLHPA